MAVANQRPSHRRTHTGTQITTSLVLLEPTAPARLLPIPAHHCANKASDGNVSSDRGLQDTAAQLAQRRRGQAGPFTGNAVNCVVKLSGVLTTQESHRAHSSWQQDRHTASVNCLTNHGHPKEHHSSAKDPNPCPHLGHIGSCTVQFTPLKGFLQHQGKQLRLASTKTLGPAGVWRQPRERGQGLGTGTCNTEDSPVPWG